jgi:hypothetical protein
MEAVDKVRAFLHSKGHQTFDPPPHLKGEADNGDFFIGVPAPDGDRIEVKHRIGRNKALLFTDKASYPYDDVLVCERHQFDDKEPTPFMFWNVNAEMTWAYVNLTADHDVWVPRRRWDNFKRRYGWFYYAPMSVTKFVNIDTPIEALVESMYPRSAWDTEE